MILHRLLNRFRLRRFIDFSPGYNCIGYECHFDTAACSPGSGGSHGVNGMEISFAVMGHHGVVTFCFQIPGLVPGRRPASMLGMMPMDVGYHARRPQHADQRPSRIPCIYFGRGTRTHCFYDGSSLMAMEVASSFAEFGEDVVWDFLEGYYRHLFHGALFPRLRRSELKPRPPRPAAPIVKEVPTDAPSEWSGTDGPGPVSPGLPTVS